MGRNSNGSRSGFGRKAEGEYEQSCNCREHCERGFSLEWRAPKYLDRIPATAEADSRTTPQTRQPQPSHTDAARARFQSRSDQRRDYASGDGCDTLARRTATRCGAATRTGRPGSGTAHASVASRENAECEAMVRRAAAECFRKHASHDRRTRGRTAQLLAGVVRRFPERPARSARFANPVECAPAATTACAGSSHGQPSPRSGMRRKALV